MTDEGKRSDFGRVRRQAIASAALGWMCDSCKTETPCGVCSVTLALVEAEQELAVNESHHERVLRDLRAAAAGEQVTVDYDSGALQLVIELHTKLAATQIELGKAKALARAEGERYQNCLDGKRLMAERLESERKGHQAVSELIKHYGSDIRALLLRECQNARQSSQLTRQLEMTSALTLWQNLMNAERDAAPPESAHQDCGIWGLSYGKRYVCRLTKGHSSPCVFVPQVKSAKVAEGETPGIWAELNRKNLLVSDLQAQLRDLTAERDALREKLESARDAIYPAAQQLESPQLWTQWHSLNEVQCSAVDRLTGWRCGLRGKHEKHLFSRGAQPTQSSSLPPGAPEERREVSRASTGGTAGADSGTFIDHQGPINEVSATGEAKPGGWHCAWPSCQNRAMKDTLCYDHQPERCPDAPKPAFAVGQLHPGDSCAHCGHARDNHEPECESCSCIRFLEPADPALVEEAPLTRGELERMLRKVISRQVDQPEGPTVHGPASFALSLLADELAKEVSK